MPLSYKPITKKEKIFYPNFILIFCKLFHYIKGYWAWLFLKRKSEKVDPIVICARESKVSMHLQSKEIQCWR